MIKGSISGLENKFMVIGCLVENGYKYILTVMYDCREIDWMGDLIDFLLVAKTIKKM